MRIACLSFPCICWVGACATTPVPAAPEYPKLEVKTTTQLTLSMANAATKLSIPCSATEPELDNGLDDNCDGQIDQGSETQAQALRVALAHPNDVDVQLVLSRGAPTFAAVAKAEEQRVCDGSAAFATQRMEVNQLDQGTYQVLLVRGARCGADKVANVNAALWLEGKTQGVYGVRVQTGETVQIATLDVK